MPELSLEEARKAMIAKRFGGNENGAKTADGGARRKKKTVHKSGAGKYTYILYKFCLFIVSIFFIYRR